jgi:ABC-type multidrug transport system ATPase subunit
MSRKNSSSELLKCLDLHLKLKSQAVLQSVSFSLQEGETVALVGHNGAGKTTLFHVILGLKHRDSGVVQLQGLDVAQPEARINIGFVPERPYLSLDSTFRRTLRYLGQLSGIPRAALERRIIELAQSVELDSVLDRPLKTFSKGMLQKTLIAQAELHRPNLLILDEPMSGLDPEARGFLKRQIQAWKTAGRTVLFSSHSMEDVKELAGRVLVMETGYLTFDGPVDSWGDRGIRAERRAERGSENP